MADRKFAADILKAMNDHRRRHQVEPLTYNDNVAMTSQKWAEHIAQAGSLSHNKQATHQGKPMGENCAMSWTSSGSDFTGQQAADQWYSEIERYDFTKQTGPQTGHFTQVVWKESKEFGVGKAKGSDGKWMVVGNFYPAGNYIGKNAENVFPTKDGKIQLPTKIAPSTGNATDKSTSNMSEVKGTSISRQTRRETTGSGPTAIVKITVTETTTDPDGRTSVKTTVTTESAGSAGSALEALDIKSNQPTETTTEFIDKVVANHNKYRAVHGNVPPLKHNPELTTLAQKWADHLASTGELEHSEEKYKGREFCENVASKSSSGHANYSADALVDQWYSESSKFDYSQPEGKPGGVVVANHFSQVVWKGSQEIGVGKALSRDGHRVVAVCNYYPPGNVRGHFKDNVLRLK